MLPIGTKVKIKENLVAGTWYGELLMGSLTQQYCGTKGKISAYCNSMFYILDTVPGHKLSEEMLEILPQVGAKVRIKENLGSYDNGISITNVMRAMGGFETIITGEETSIFCADNVYKLGIDDGYFIWTEGMFDVIGFAEVVNNTAKQIIDIFEHHKTYCIGGTK